MTIEEKIKEIITEHLGVHFSQVQRETKLEDIYADSLDVVEIVMACEEQFKVEFSDEIIHKTDTTVGDIVDYFEKQLTGRIK